MTLDHRVATMALDRIAATMTFDASVASDTIVAFVFPLAGLLTSLPVMWRKEQVWNLCVLK
jgi:hypothetical protein